MITIQELLISRGLSKTAKIKLMILFDFIAVSPFKVFAVKQNMQI